MKKKGAESPTSPNTHFTITNSSLPTHRLNPPETNPPPQPVEKPPLNPWETPSSRQKTHRNIPSPTASPFAGITLSHRRLQWPESSKICRNPPEAPPDLVRPPPQPCRTSTAALTDLSFLLLCITATSLFLYYFSSSNTNVTRKRWNPLALSTSISDITQHMTENLLTILSRITIDEGCSGWE